MLALFSCIQQENYKIALLFVHVYAFCLTEPICFIFNTLEPDYISSIYSTCIYYVNMYTCVRGLGSINRWAEFPTPNWKQSWTFQKLIVEKITN